MIARSRLRVDARKWLAGKMNAKRYGDKIDATLANPDGSAIKFAAEVTFVHAKPQ